MKSIVKGKNNDKMIYFAGPWFTGEQELYYNMMMDSICASRAKRSLKYSVFFPKLFTGTPDECFKADIMAIDMSDILIAWLDHKDCGTSFEMGYAKAKGKKIIVLVTNIESLKNSKTNLMLAKSADGILFIENLTAFMDGTEEPSDMINLNWEEIE